ncbi:helix-turn-helix domain-containing protein [Candidatus Nanohalococcus occultus]|uniref:Signal transduction histidine kinase, contains PAS domain n=1 Tax=Candidatus Nanohalococcus occultus TaxID=2978047 RepID=A0ABY8CGL6_9ARCH|nr:Signal transduction histidine kinase, contains PAS domain [Candidatus Nanohaloarchaeota archaeon SVXNc]
MKRTKRDFDAVKRTEKVCKAISHLSSNAGRDTRQLEVELCELLDNDTYENVCICRKTSENSLRHLAGEMEARQKEIFESPRPEELGIEKAWRESEIVDSRENPLGERFIAIPINYNNLVYRVLMIFPGEGKEISEKELNSLEILAEVLGVLIKDERQEALVYAEKILELTVNVPTQRVLLSSLGGLDGGIKVEKFVPLEENSNKYMLKYEDSEKLSSALDKLEIVENYSITETGYFEITTTNDRLRGILDAGGMICGIDIDDRKLRMTIQIASDAEKQALYDVLNGISEDWKVLKKEFLSSKKIISTTESRDWGLTEKQFSALKSAYTSGYYDNPRKVTAKELSSKIGISDSTLFQHLQAAHLKLIGEILGPDAKRKRLSENKLD